MVHERARSTAISISVSEAEGAKHGWLVLPGSWRRQGTDISLFFFLSSSYHLCLNFRSRINILSQSSFKDCSNPALPNVHQRERISLPRAVLELSSQVASINQCFDGIFFISHDHGEAWQPACRKEGPCQSEILVLSLLQMCWFKIQTSRHRTLLFSKGKHFYS